jgi:predicted nucleic acid-binding protein
LRFLLRGCEIEPFTEERAESTGELVGLARTADIVDASVVECARRWGAAILTADRGDIERLLQAASIDLVVISI